MNHYSVVERLIRTNFNITGDIDFLEIGVAGGTMEKHLLSVFPLIRITCIDIGANPFSAEELQRIRFMQGNSNDAINSLLSERFDFIYIDGEHTYFQCKADIDNYYRLLKNGGIIAGHDYHEPHGVIKAVNERFPERILDDDLVWFTRLIKKEW